MTTTTLMPGTYGAQTVPSGETLISSGGPLVTSITSAAVANQEVVNIAGDNAQVGDLSGDGFTIADTAAGGVAVQMLGSNGTLEGNVLSSDGGEGADVVTGGGADNLLMDGNTFGGTGFALVYVNGALDFGAPTVTTAVNIENNQFTGTATAGADISDDAASGTISGNTFSGSGNQAIFLGTVSQAVANAFNSSPGNPYVPVPGTITVSDNNFSGWTGADISTWDANYTFANGGAGHSLTETVTASGQEIDTLTGYQSGDQIAVDTGLVTATGVSQNGAGEADVSLSSGDEIVVQGATVNATTIASMVGLPFLVYDSNGNLATATASITAAESYVDTNFATLTGGPDPVTVTAGTGTYTGSVAITEPQILDSSGGAAATTITSAAATNQEVVDIDAANAQVGNLSGGGFTISDTGAGGVAVQMLGSNGTLEGNTISADGGSAGADVVTGGGADNLLIDGNTFAGAGFALVYVNGALDGLSESTSVDIENNQFTGTATAGADISDDAASGTISGNTFSGSGSQAIFLGTVTAAAAKFFNTNDGTSYVPIAGTTTVTGNTFTGWTGADISTWDANYTFANGGAGHSLTETVTASGQEIDTLTGYQSGDQIAIDTGLVTATGVLQNGAGEADIFLSSGDEIIVKGASVSASTIAAMVGAPLLTVLVYDSNGNLATGTASITAAESYVNANFATLTGGPHPVTVTAGAGTYTGDVAITEPQTLDSSGGAAVTTIDGAADNYGFSGAVFVNAAGTTLGGTGAGFTINEDASENAGVLINGGIAGVTISGNVINGDAANTHLNEDLLTAGGDDGLKIAGNTFAGTASQLIYINGTADGETDTNNVTISGNTFSGSAGADIVADISSGAITGNTFTGGAKGDLAIFVGAPSATFAAEISAHFFPVAGTVTVSGNNFTGYHGDDVGTALATYDFVAGGAGAALSVAVAASGFETDTLAGYQSGDRLSLDTGVFVPLGVVQNGSGQADILLSSGDEIVVEGAKVNAATIAGMVDAPLLQGTLVMIPSTDSGNLGVIGAGNGATIIDALQDSNSITFSTGNGSDTVFLGSNDTVTLGNGLDTASLFGSGDKLTLGNGIDVVNVAGSHDTVSGGTTDAYNVTGNNNTVTLGNGIDVAVVSGNDNTIKGGNGADGFSISGSGNTLTLGSGVNLTSISGNNNTVNGGSGADIYIVDGNGNLVSLQGKGNTVLVSGGTGNTINDTSGGVDHLQLTVADTGTVGFSLTNFSTAHGVIDLSPGGSAPTSFTKVLADMTQTGSGASAVTTLHYGSTSIAFDGIAKSQFVAGDFSFHLA